jgi:hypothetical protein
MCAARLESFNSWLDEVEKTETAKLAAQPSGKPPKVAGDASGGAGGGGGAGDKWWDIPEQKLTRETKRDLQIIASRNYLDPKRFYKVP